MIQLGSNLLKEEMYAIHFRVNMKDARTPDTSGIGVQIKYCRPARLQLIDYLKEKKISFI